MAQSHARRDDELSDAVAPMRDGSREPRRRVHPICRGRHRRNARLRRRREGPPDRRCDVPIGGERRRFDRGRPWLSSRSSRSPPTRRIDLAARGVAQRHADHDRGVRRGRPARHVPPRGSRRTATSSPSRPGYRGRITPSRRCSCGAWPLRRTCKGRASVRSCSRLVARAPRRPHPWFGPGRATRRSTSTSATASPSTARVSSTNRPGNPTTSSSAACGRDVAFRQFPLSAIDRASVLCMSTQVQVEKLRATATRLRSVSASIARQPSAHRLHASPDPRPGSARLLSRATTHCLACGGNCRRTSRRSPTPPADSNGKPTRSNSSRRFSS